MKILYGAGIALLCFALHAADQTQYRMEMTACHTGEKEHSAALDSPDWRRAPAYPFRKLICYLNDFHRLPAEGAAVKLLYDDNYLYVGVKMTDSDVITTGTQNQSPLYALGDVIEVFVKPEHEKYYWEIYGTPNKLSTRYYYPSRGTLGMPSGFGPTEVKIPVDARVSGTLNDERDRDRGWNVLIFIPLAELRKNGLKFTDSEEWTIFVSRYNYSRFLPASELSSVPQVYRSYHNLHSYARLRIEPKPAEK